MRDERKTKAQLIDELKELHKQTAGLKRPDTRRASRKVATREIEKHFGPLLDNIHDGVYLLNDKGYFVYVNSVIE
ncbi:MAG: hypothetical protein JJE15_11050, partial [Desulfobacteraceae bacterium]|nr:hypothetical protein [Desulfobacteraceae bacterium]